MKFRSQRVAYLFFATSLALFCLQIVFGFIMAVAHMGYDVLHEVIPFNAARASHLNLWWCGCSRASWARPTT